MNDGGWLWVLGDRKSVDVLKGLWKADRMNRTRLATADERRQEFLYTSSCGSGAVGFPRDGLGAHSGAQVAVVRPS